MHPARPSSVDIELITRRKVYLDYYVKYWQLYVFILCIINVMFISCSVITFHPKYKHIRRRDRVESGKRPFFTLSLFRFYIPVRIGIPIDIGKGDPMNAIPTSYGHLKL